MRRGTDHVGGGEGGVHDDIISSHTRTKERITRTNERENGESDAYRIHCYCTRAEERGRASVDYVYTVRRLRF